MGARPSPAPVMPSPPLSAAGIGSTNDYEPRCALSLLAIPGDQREVEPPGGGDVDGIAAAEPNIRGEGGGRHIRGPARADLGGQPVEIGPNAARILLLCRMRAARCVRS